MRRATRIFHVVAVLLALSVVVAESAVMVERPNARVTGFELTVSSVDASEAFFTKVLGFTAADPLPRDAGVRRLRLGEETVTLRQRPAGVGEPPRLPANDPSFQHLAIVVSDLDAAYARLQRAETDIVSAGPQALPAWNRAAAGIRAVYFRDPDGHFLELIEYPPGKGEPRWHRDAPPLFLGIDHTAVVSTDTAASVDHYVDELGLRVVGDGLNYGVEQERLSGVPGSRVYVTSLRGLSGPGVELLEYESPPPPPSHVARDWQIDLDTSGRPAAADTADHDGHAQQLAAAPAVAWSLPLARRTFDEHWPRYLMEAAELGVFMVVTIWVVLLLEHPSSPVRQRIGSAAVRRVGMGLVIGATVVILIKSPWGFESGAHFNPAVTLAFYRLGEIGPWDAIFYVAFQFAGGLAGVVLASLPFWNATHHPDVRFVATVPGDAGVAAAFAAELFISFVLLATLLLLKSHPPLKG